jgi:hypothetical protein
MTKRCPKCHTQNRLDARFCLACQQAFSEVSSILCPAGRHVMDPAWSACPYCGDPQVGTVPTTSVDHPVIPLAPQGRQRTPTQIESQAHRQPPGVSREEAGQSTPHSSARHKTSFGSAAPAAISPQPAAVVPSPQQGIRRIVAVLVTYTWHPAGQIFPVYEGRTYLGRDPDCEICLTTDSQLSSKHAAIFYRCVSVKSAIGLLRVCACFCTA